MPLRTRGPSYPCWMPLPHRLAHLRRPIRSSVVGPQQVEVNVAARRCRTTAAREAKALRLRPLQQRLKPLADPDAACCDTFHDGSRTPSYRTARARTLEARSCEIPSYRTVESYREEGAVLVAVWLVLAGEVAGHADRRV